jgi:transposase
VSKRLSARYAHQVLARVRARDELGRLRRQLLADQVSDLEAIDRKILSVNKQIKAKIKTTKTTVTEVFGFGPINTARILGDVRDVARFKSRHHFASYNGTAPTVWGSGGPSQPAVNPKGNGKLNHAIPIAAVTQVRSKTPAGHACYARKVAEGKTHNEAMRALKRRIFDTVYRHLVADAVAAAKRGPGGQVGTSPTASVTGPTPTAGSSVRPQPGPRPNPTPRPAA